MAPRFAAPAPTPEASKVEFVEAPAEAEHDFEDAVAIAERLGAFPETDDWQLDEDLRHAERLLRRMKLSDSSPPANVERRIDGAAPAPLGWHQASTTKRRHARGRRRAVMVSWCMLAVGLMSFACGGVLMVWSFVAARPDLWTIGMPLSLIGQAGLLIGLVLQLEGLWQTNLETTETLTNLDGQLSDLQQATNLLSSSRSTSSQSFYAHLSHGASPQVLLTDLKGQMDILAERLAQTSR